MILVTGPTGSGKSTTLYAAIATINNPDINIITAEDPVEFNIAGINQVLVREDIGYNFAAALRAFLRQDPDVILVGEMRDGDGADRDPRRADRTSGVLDPAHERRPQHRDAARGHGHPALPDLLVAPLGHRPASGPADLSGVPGARAGAGVALIDVGFRPEEAESLRSTPARVRELRQYRLQGPDLRARDHVDDPRAPGSHRAAAAGQRDQGHRREAGMRTLRQTGLRKVANGLTTIDEVLRVTFAD